MLTVLNWLGWLKYGKGNTQRIERYPVPAWLALLQQKGARVVAACSAALETEQPIRDDHRSAKR